MDDERVQQFRESGYTTVPGFFEPDEVRAMRAEARRLLDGGLLRDVSTDPERRQNLQLMPLDRVSPLFRAVPYAPKVIDAVGRLIGRPVVKILDQMFTKPAFSGMGTSWHTDNAYFKLVEPMGGTAMWIAIDDATVENGTLQVVPRAFRDAPAHFRDPASDHHIRTVVDEGRAVHCELAAGGVVFFCFGTPHATGDNRTCEPRSGVGIHFVNEASAAGLFEDRWQRIRLSGPAFNEGVSEYAERVDFAAEVGKLIGS